MFHHSKVVNLVWVGGGESGGWSIDFVFIALLDFQLMKSKSNEKT